MKLGSLCLAFLFLLLAAFATGLASNADTCKGKVTFDSVYSVKVHESLPLYQIRLKEMKLPPDTLPEAADWGYEMDIQPSGGTQAMQTICGKSDSPFEDQMEDEFPGITFTDLNFDGYTDIKMFNGSSVNGDNKSYAVYLFNPASHLFVYHEKFSEIIAGMSLKMDPRNKEITSFGRLGNAGDAWSEETYQVKGDQLILIRSTTQDQDADGNFVLVKKKLVNGVLTVISKQKVNPSGVDR